MRRLLVTVAATVAILGLTAGTASANWWGHKPAGSIVDVDVEASSANGPDSNPYD